MSKALADLKIPDQEQPELEEHLDQYARWLSHLAECLTMIVPVPA